MFSSLMTRCLVGGGRPAGVGRGLIVAALMSVAVGALDVSPAVAANQMVGVADNNYTAPGVAVQPGESVTWSYPLGAGSDHHNVHFEDEQFTSPAIPSFSPWMATRTFPEAGVYRYYCDEHGGPGGQGMFGKVYVNATGTLPAGAPTASFTATPAAVGVSSNVAFDATDSSDPGGAIVRYEWDLDGDGLYERDTGPQAQTTWSYLTPGTRTVGLRVTDADALSSETTRQVQVTSRPTAAFTVSPSPAQAGQTVSFDGSQSADPDGSIARYEWDLDGDGSYETDSGATSTVSRTYPAPGTVSVALRVTDNLGVVSTATTKVLQVDAPPVPPPPPIAPPPPAPPPPAAIAPPPAPPPPPTAQIPRLGSAIVYSARAGTRYTVLTALSVRSARAGSTVRLSCTGKRCPFTTKTRRLTKNAARLDLLSLVRGKRLRPGAKLEIRVTKPATIGVVRRLTIRAGRSPRSESLCIAPGATRPSPCSS